MKLAMVRVLEHMVEVAVDKAQALLDMVVPVHTLAKVQVLQHPHHGQFHCSAIPWKAW
jgi:hypothetical protein